MQVLGNLQLVGGGSIRGLRVEQLGTDPLVGDLLEARVWYNTATKALKYFDGTEVHTLAKGGNLTDYVRHDGTVAMTGALVLNSDDQSAAADNVAVSKGHLDTELALKQNNITGAATSILSSDLTASRAVISDAAGKVAVSNVTTTELGYLSGVTSGVQAQIDSKQNNLGYVPVNKAGDSMSGNLAMGDNRIIGLAAPIGATDAARKIDLDNAIANLNWQEDVLAVQVDATLVPSTVEGARYIITNSAALNAGFGTIAGLGDGDIVEYTGGEFVVAYDVSVAAANAAGTLATDLATGRFVRFNGTAWSAFEGMEALVAGIGLARSGNVINVNLGAGVAELPTDEIGIDVRANSGLFLTVDGTTDTTDAAAQLAIRLGGNNSISFDVGGGIQVASQGVQASMLGEVAGNGIQGGQGVSLSVKAADASLVVDASGVKLNETHTNGIYARQDGAAFSGAVTVQTPTAAANPTTKAYVDGLLQNSNNDLDALEARVSAGHFVYDSTASGTNTAAATHTVNHNIGTKYCQVTVVDDADEVIMPDSISFVSATQLTVGFTVAIKCRVIVTAVAPAA